jgi:hypothetical protein
METTLKDITTEKITKVRIQEFDGCLWFYLNGEEFATFLVESVDNIVNVCMYPTDDPDEEPDVFPTRHKGTN